MPRTVAMLAALAALHMCSARSPLPAASTRAALAATCVCATLRTHSARAARCRVAVRAPAHAPVGHRARVGRARAVGVDRGHPVEHAHRGFPRRHARHGAHGRDRHAHGAVLAAARAAQGRPPALPCPARSPPSHSVVRGPQSGPVRLEQPWPSRDLVALCLVHGTPLEKRGPPPCEPPGREE